MTEKLSRRDTEAKINVRAWKDPTFKKKLEDNPHLALRDLGMSKVPVDLKIQVVEEERDEWIIRLGKRPLNFKELSEESLEKVALGEMQEAKCCPKSPS